MSAVPPVAKLLQQLVRIPSVNPSGDPGTPHVGEKKIALFLKEKLRSLGAKVELQMAAPGRPNVIARFPARRKSERAVLIEPHTDTVSVLGMTVEPFGGEIKNGRVWGRGACDTKGPMAAMLSAIAGIARAKKFPETTDIYYVAAMGEEAGNEGALHLMQSKYFQKQRVKVEFAIALEPTEMQIVHKHKGAMWLKITSHGRAVHGSRPELGENAILKMVDAIGFLSRDLPALYAKFEDPDLGKPSFSVNLIRGGSKVNIVPDWCEIEVDHRALPREKEADLVKLLRERLQGFDVKVTSSRPGLHTPSDHAHVRKLKAALCEHGRGDNALAAAPWFADSGVFGEAGIPSVAFGPGSIAQAHTRDEYIDIDELVAGEEIFRTYLENLE
ncbi:MAG: ArgE/DapE family deacylase [Verrucomicrobiae bacterium]|nr:ArgE/DapE family deacylase [Verrucomicrobiae bacterium]